MSADQAELACRVRNIPLLPDFSIWSCSSPWFEVSVPMEQLGSFHKLRRVPLSSTRPFYWKRSISAWNKCSRNTNMQYSNFKTKVFNKGNLVIYEKKGSDLGGRKQGKVKKHTKVQLNATVVRHSIYFYVVPQLPSSLNNSLIPRCIQQPMCCSLETKPNKALPALGFHQ